MSAPRRGYRDREGTQRTTSSAIAMRLCSSTRAAIFSSSSLVKTLPMGLCGVLIMMIFVRGVIAALHNSPVRHRSAPGGSASLPQLVEIDLPVVAGGLRLGRVRVQRDVDALASVEDDGRQVLVEEGFKHDDLIARVQEGSEDRVLACRSRLSILCVHALEGRAHLRWHRW